VTRLPDDALDAALGTLLADGRIERLQKDDGSEAYRSARFDVPLDASQGWEAAVLDHFQAMVSGLSTKLRGGRAHASSGDETGGATYTLDVWSGHPYEAQARGLLADTRRRLDELRVRIDAHNAKVERPSHIEPVVFYAGQYVKAEVEQSDDE
jgi:hypothetical protein